MIVPAPRLDQAACWPPIALMAERTALLVCAALRILQTGLLTVDHRLPAARPKQAFTRRWGGPRRESGEAPHRPQLPLPSNHGVPSAMSPKGSTTELESTGSGLRMSVAGQCVKPTKQILLWGSHLSGGLSRGALSTFPGFFPPPDLYNQLPSDRLRLSSQCERLKTAAISGSAVDRDLSSLPSLDESLGSSDLTAQPCWLADPHTPSTRSNCGRSALLISARRAIAGRGRTRQRLAAALCGPQFVWQRHSQ